MKKLESGYDNNECNVLHSESVVEEKKIEGELNGIGFCYVGIENNRLHRILRSYEGIHNFHNYPTNFHNFITRTKAS